MCDLSYALMWEQTQTRVLGEQQALVTAAALGSEEAAKRIPNLAHEREEFEALLRAEFATAENTPQLALRRALGVGLNARRS